jgi:hypothetical protein
MDCRRRRHSGNGSLDYILNACLPESRQDGISNEANVYGLYRREVEYPLLGYTCECLTFGIWDTKLEMRLRTDP